MSEFPRVTRETFRAELERLAASFAANEDEYTSPAYPEAQVRLDFIDPFFRALGWDIENRANLPYSKRDVIVERGAEEGRPDYTFRIDGAPRFFVEAKAPHEKLENHVLRTKRYAWSTKQVFAVVLTDFEEFQFYDASLEPDPKHPLYGQRIDLRYPKYLDHIDRLWQLSRECVAAGSIDTLLIPDREKRALRYRLSVDDRFLEDMTRWREGLARAVHRRNPHLNDHALTDVVQRLLDRLIFIRVAEDRRIWEKLSLWERVQDWKMMGGKKPLLPMLNDLFQQVNEDFNGEIFKSHACEGISLDDWRLGEIVEELYPPHGPYRFDVIPVDIFGAVYERYLGKIIKVRGKDVNVEDKPEVRKAGGVYYTPKYIVDYIVKHTIGGLIEGKNPKEIEKIRILDPACGSGSFLLAAFQYLIDYHIAYYEKHPKEAHVRPLMPELLKDGNGMPRLSIHRKARILRQNLHGVDLDAQAVEITMMNLYLRALEGERDLPHKQQLLPELKYNIRRGNSLIGPDITEDQKLSEEELQRLNPFNWESKTEGFGNILQDGGFDAVIGNPPYLFITEISDLEKAVFEKSYSTFMYRYDVYGLFLEKTVRDLLKNGGVAGFIIPHTVLSNDSFEKLRRLLLTETQLRNVVDIGPGVFQGAKNETMVLIAERLAKPGDAKQPTEVSLTSAASFPNPHNRYELPQTAWLSNPKARWQVGVTPRDSIIVRKLSSAAHRLGQLCDINQGLRTGDNQKYLSLRQQSKKWKPAAGGKDVGRYEPIRVRQFVLYDPHKLDAPRRPEIFESAEKLVVQEIRNISLPRRIVATYDNEQIYVLQSTNVVNLKEKASKHWSLKYLLGILNSEAANFFFRHSFPGNNHIASWQLSEVPIPRAGKRVQEQVARMVDTLLNLHSKLSDTNRADRKAIQGRIRRIEGMLDRVTHDLYGLTAEERRLVEEHKAK